MREQLVCIGCSCLTVFLYLTHILGHLRRTERASGRLSGILAEAYYFLEEQGCINFGILQDEEKQGAAVECMIEPMHKASLLKVEMCVDHGLSQPLALKLYKQNIQLFPAFCKVFHADHVFCSCLYRKSVVRKPLQAASDSQHGCTFLIALFLGCVRACARPCV